MAFVPLLPALSYMALVSFVFGLFDRFVHLTVIELLILVSITALSIIVDHLSGILGAKYGGAHGTSLLWGIVGSIIGTFIAPLFGSLAGLFVGIVGRELWIGRGKLRATKSATGALAGTIVGVVVNVALAIVFIVLFVGFSLSN